MEAPSSGSRGTPRNRPGTLGAPPESHEERGYMHTLHYSLTTVLNCSTVQYNRHPPLYCRQHILRNGPWSGVLPSGSPWQ